MAEDRKTIRQDNQPIVFSERLVGSDVFRGMFKEGMALVEETANYLDGEGRTASRNLNRAASLAYATESMRLTTRLMQLASWLLLQRAVNEGEMSAEQAKAEKSKVKLSGLASSTEGVGWDNLPDELKDLVGRSLRLQERIKKLEGTVDPGEPVNPVATQLGLLATAFRSPGGGA